MGRLQLCAVFLCVSLVIHISKGDTTENPGILNRAKSKVKDLISNIRKPSSERDPPPAPTVTRGAGAGGKLKEKIKKVNKSLNFKQTNLNFS